MHSKVGIPAILFLIALFVNLVYTTSQVTGEDSGELIIAAYTLGIPHPPGYPLWSMLGYLFTYVPFGSIAWRVHLLSKVFAALSLVMLCLVFLCFFQQFFQLHLATLGYTTSQAKSPRV